MTLDKIKTSTGRKLRGEALQETVLPIPYDAAAMPGATVLGTDGQMYSSIKSPSGSYVWAFAAQVVSKQLLVNIDQIFPESGALALGGAVETGDAETGPARLLLIPERDPSPSLAGGILGRLEFCSRGIRTSKTTLQSPATIRASADRFNWSETSKPTSLVFHCTADGAAGHSLRFRLDASGSADINNALGQLSFRVSDTGNVLINNSTGTERLSVTGNIQLTDTADSFKVGTNNVVGSRKTGWAAPTGTATRTTFATYAGQDASATYVEAEVQAIDDHVKVLSERLKALIDDLTSHGLIGPTPA